MCVILDKSIKYVEELRRALEKKNIYIYIVYFSKFQQLKLCMIKYD